MPKYADISNIHIPKGFFEGLNVPKLLSWLESLPAADVEEVKHGEWIQCTNFPRMHWCSECNREVFDDTDALYVKFPYCHCGAKMDGKENDSAEIH